MGKSPQRVFLKTGYSIQGHIDALLLRYLSITKLYILIIISCVKTIAIYPHSKNIKETAYVTRNLKLALLSTINFIQKVR